MKKCPTCQKEFPDTMRFCQSDGTPLTEVVEQEPVDLLKTQVVRPEELAAVLPPSDPYKTVVAGEGGLRDESGDLLQLPEQEDLDPMKTMIAAPIVAAAPSAPEPEPSAPEPIAEPPAPEAFNAEPVAPEPPKFEDIRQEIKPATPSPFDAFSSQPEPSAPATPFESAAPAQPEPPKFSEPELSPPNFGAAAEPEEDMAATMIQGSWEPPTPEPAPVSPAMPQDPPASPFGAPPPASPFGEPPPASPFAAPSFDPATPQFGQQQFDNASQDLGPGSLQQQAEWLPPAPPEQGWQDQGLGANTPFQPPVAGAPGGNKTLAIVSLVSGILSLLCCFSIITGPLAVVMSIMANKNIAAEPHIYGGAGLAKAGMITGVIGTIIGTAAMILQIISLMAR